MGFLINGSSPFFFFSLFLIQGDDIKIKDYDHSGVFGGSSRNEFHCTTMNRGALGPASKDIIERRYPGSGSGCSGTEQEGLDGNWGLATLMSASAGG
jgi:hypothetical protein